MRATPKWTPQDRTLNTVPGRSPGIVAHWPRTKTQPRYLVTVQCQACLRTYTDEALAAVRACNFSPDPGESGWLNYRRCADCIATRKHP